MEALVLRKKNCINFSKARTNLCLCLHYNGDNSYLFLNRKNILRFIANNNNVNFLTQFCLEWVSNGLGATESRTVSFKGNVYDFSVLLINVKHSQVFNGQV